VFERLFLNDTPPAADNHTIIGLMETIFASFMRSSNSTIYAEIGAITFTRVTCVDGALIHASKHGACIAEGAVPCARRRSPNKRCIPHRSTLGSGIIVHQSTFGPCPRTGNNNLSPCAQASSYIIFQGPSRLYSRHRSLYGPHTTVVSMQKTQPAKEIRFTKGKNCL
jgi:hypothetical protein